MGLEVDIKDDPGRADPNSLFGRAANKYSENLMIARMPRRYNGHESRRIL